MADALQMLALFSPIVPDKLIELRLPPGSCPYCICIDFHHEGYLNRGRWQSSWPQISNQALVVLLICLVQLPELFLPTFLTANPKPRIYACALLTPGISLLLNPNTLPLHPNSLHSIPSVWPVFLAVWMPIRWSSLALILQFGLMYWVFILTFEDGVA